MKLERGSSILEVILAIALLGLISVSFLGGVANTSNARVTADERASAKILAEDIIDKIKKEVFYTSYNISVENSFPEFVGYTANITVENMSNDSIQKITVAVIHRDREVLTLEDYKVNR